MREREKRRGRERRPDEKTERESGGSCCPFMARIATKDSDCSVCVCVCHIPISSLSLFISFFLFSLFYFFPRPGYSRLCLMSQLVLSCFMCACVRMSALTRRPFFSFIFPHHLTSILFGCEPTDRSE